MAARINVDNKSNIGDTTDHSEPNTPVKTVSEQSQQMQTGQSAQAKQSVQPQQSNQEPEEKKEEEVYEIPLESSNKKIYFLALLLAIIFISATLGIFYLLSRLDRTVEEGAPIESGELVTEAEVIDDFETKVSPDVLARDQITVEILNGSGISGEAGRVADIFDELGYETTTGNAEETVGSLLYINPDYDEGELSLLFDDIKEELGIVRSSGELEGDEIVARIVLGVKESEENEEE